MKSRSAAAALVISAIYASSVFAQGIQRRSIHTSSVFVPGIQRSFVSAATGSDSNPCTRPLPCRNFTAAANVTSARGEIIVLDSGGYGSATFNKSLSVIAPSGVYAGVTALSGNALSVNAAAADTVTIRGVTANGLGAQTVLFVSSGDVIVDSCSFANFILYGREIISGGQATIRRTMTRSNGIIGMLFSGPSPSAITHATVVDSTAANNNVGFQPSQYSRVTIVGSLAAQNTAAGIYACCLDAKLWLMRSTSANNNGHGVDAGPHESEIYAAYNTVTGNPSGMTEEETGQIFSMQNNLVRGNGTNLNATLTAFPPQ